MGLARCTQVCALRKVLVSHYRSGVFRVSHWLKLQKVVQLGIAYKSSFVCDQVSISFAHAFHAGRECLCPILVLSKLSNWPKALKMFLVGT